tara:strand:- start:80 stop:934 length:855 start_codon:yes stop_codon:yes gene_type:complete
MAKLKQIEDKDTPDLSGTTGGEKTPLSAKQQAAENLAKTESEISKVGDPGYGLHMAKKGVAQEVKGAEDLVKATKENVEKVKAGPTTGLSAFRDLRPDMDTRQAGALAVSEAQKNEEKIAKAKEKVAAAEQDLGTVQVEAGETAEAGLGSIAGVAEKDLTDLADVDAAYATEIASIISRFKDQGFMNLDDDELQMSNHGQAALKEMYLDVYFPDLDVSEMWGMGHKWNEHLWDPTFKWLYALTKDKDAIGPDGQTATALQVKVAKKYIKERIRLTNILNKTEDV